MKWRTVAEFFEEHVRGRVNVAVVLIVTLVVVETSGLISNGLNNIERWNFSVRQREYSTSRTDKNIDIVGIDDYTLASSEIKKHFGIWPFKRDIWPYIIRYFNRAEAKALALDITFRRGDDPENRGPDKAFAQSVSSSQIPVSVVLLSKWVDEKDAPKPELDASVMREQVKLSGATRRIGYARKNWIEKSMEQLKQSSMHFYIANSLKRDREGVVRWTHPFASFGADSIFPTLPLALALGPEREIKVLPNGNLRTKKRDFDLSGQKHPLIRWYGDVRGASGRTETGELLHSQVRHRNQNLGPILGFIDAQIQNYWGKRAEQIPDVYPKYSFWDILYSEVKLECDENAAHAICQTFDFSAPATYISPDRFKDHYVLLGQTVDNSFKADVHKTIYGGSNYHGVYIQANILDNYLNNDFVRPLDAHWTWLTVLFVLCVGGFVCLKRSVLFATSIAVSMAGAYWIATIVAYDHMNLWVNFTYPMVTLLLVFTGSFAYRYFSSEKRKQQFRNAFAKYVSSGVMQSIEKNPEKLTLGGQRKELTMLFSDIRGFTTFSENNDPEVVQSFLTEYFSVMNSIILDDYHGSINKLIGDAIMAYWGFPLENDDQAFLAVCAALKMREAMETWNKDNSHPPVNIGIGINTGDAMIGNVGSKDFMDFTVIGDSVNTAARLESLNKEHGTNIIISESTYEKVKHRIRVRELGAVHVKGKEKAVNIYEPLSFKYPEELLLKGAERSALEKSTGTRGEESGTRT